MDRVAQGLERAVRKLDEGGEAAYDAAEAIITTDRVPKLAACAFYAGDRRYVVGGIAKGSGMIAPNLATMLAFIATDAPMSRDALQRELPAASDETFNMISVDGDMSTNDAVYAVRAAGRRRRRPKVSAPRCGRWRATLAVAMVRDGEGATKTLTVDVGGRRNARAGAHDRARDRQQQLGRRPRCTAKTRTGAASSRPPAARVPDSIRRTWSLSLNGKPWVDRGAIEVLSEAEAHRELEGRGRLASRLDLGIGDAAATAWGCDLSRDYVRINASYRT